MQQNIEVKSQKDFQRTIVINYLKVKVVIMEKTFITFVFIVSILALFWQLFLFLKKIDFLLKYSKKTQSFKIFQPDYKGILHVSIYLLPLFILNIRLYDQIFSYDFIYEEYGEYWYLVLVFYLPIYSVMLLSICNEFFPTIVTKEYICYMCEKIYGKESVIYTYDNINIIIYFETNNLVIKRRKKYDSLISILDTYYKRKCEY